MQEINIPELSQLYSQKRLSIALWEAIESDSTITEGFLIEVEREGKEIVANRILKRFLQLLNKEEVMGCRRL